MRTKFKNANEAYNYFHDKIIVDGVPFGDTKALFNVGFTMENPMQNHIKNKERNWKLDYAEAEWLWYLSGDPSIKRLGEIYGKIPAIWQKMADSDGNVMSNYGWQWKRNDQIHYVVGKLREYPDTRHAAISIYDCKEFDKYRNDTPCTYAVQFTILDNRLNMSVYMRSNDLWYGFCNDQYQFSNLQQMVADRLSIDVGTYYHHAHNLHLYNNKL
jgi:thymidylate synthase|tara:strand:+ start:6494 stop:7135 length:642 start_codon:yes stop_codon:yes gene_type:complete